jgi:hypothetical protein
VDEVRVFSRFQDEEERDHILSRGYFVRLVHFWQSQIQMIGSIRMEKYARVQHKDQHVMVRADGTFPRLCGEITRSVGKNILATLWR